MAATAVYASIARISEGGGTAEDSVLFTNIAATTASFLLRGGVYLMSVIGSTFGTVTLQILGPDGTTWLTALTAFAANGTATVSLPTSSCRVLIA